MFFAKNVQRIERFANIKNYYVAADNIEIGYKNTIPLWLFGFLY